MLTHIVGDAITTAGVPMPLLWILNRGRLVFFPMRTGATLEKAVLVPLFLAATVGFIYVNTEVRDAVDPLVERLLARALGSTTVGSSRCGATLRPAAELGQHPRRRDPPAGRARPPRCRSCTRTWR